MKVFWIFGILSVAVMAAGLGSLIDWYSGAGNTEVVFYAWQPICFVVGVLLLNIWHLRGLERSIKGFKPETQIKLVLGVVLVVVGTNWWLIEKTVVIGYDQWGISLLLTGMVLLIFSYLDHRATES